MRKKINMYFSAILFVLAFITSCDKDEEIMPAVFSITPVEKDFGIIEVEKSTNYSFEITNEGEAVLEIKEYAIIGTNASDFSINAVAVNIEKNDSYDFELTFAPLTIGIKEAVLEITTNVGVKNIALNGEGIAKPIPVIQFSESPVNFGNVLIEQNLSKNVTISNIGNADLEITSANISSGSTVFSITGSPSSLIKTIPSGDSYTFEVKFTPNSLGAASGILRLVNNSNASEINLEMNGIGIVPALPEINLSETGLNFGNVNIGSSSSDLTFDIQNNGQGNLEVSNINLSGANSSDFTLVGVSYPITILPNNSYTVTVRFTPQSEGRKYGRVNIVSNDPTKPNYALIIEGNGLSTTSNIVNIPDSNFKAALVANSSINTNGDSEIQISEAQSYSGVVRVDGLTISDLTGLEEFVNISEFHAMNNSLTSIDLSQNTAITRLSLTNNDLTSLDLSTNIILKTILIQNNNISSIDLTNHSSLVNFQCGNNNISNLVLPTTANGLRTLYLEQNKISTLDVSMYSDLRTLSVYNNNLTNLDISPNTKIRALHVRNNKLSSLNVANGNNVNFIYMVADRNTDLTCIQHDAGFDPLNPPNTAVNQWAKPSGASWSTTACP
ncbi:Choice-of-anchor D domain-containing protein [Tenacibaculum sp. 190130A14a]|uniref:ASPM-SPD-2-Hydin domain-containing protein n=1 Tax=Tenacibaculum polynesiense TaxID=3137857 RepID=A0ABM9PFU4_9FLAO